MKTHIAHGNSFVIGIPLAILFLRVLKPRKTEERILLITAILLGIATTVLAVRSFAYYFTVIAPMEEPWVTYCREDDNGVPRNDSSLVSPSC